jgi:hypothetical protein
MKRNNVSGVNNIINVLREVSDLIHLRTEIEKLKQMKNNYLLNQNTIGYKPLLPLGLPKHHYHY